MEARRSHRDPLPESEAHDAVAPRDAVLPAKGCPAFTRNLFADGRDLAQVVRYRGLGSVEETANALQPVARAMSRPLRRRTRPEGSMPAGYTYLAQLVAHDIAVFSGGTRGGGFGYYRNKSAQEVLLQPMSLSSIYGPAETAAHGVVEDEDHAGLARVHRFRAIPGDPGSPPMFDLFRTEQGALVYDPRNDDSPILAQTCALFLGFHNHCAAHLDGRFAPDDVFRFARRLTTAAYHRIVRRDLLGKMLHPVVQGFYESDEVLIDRGAVGNILPAVEMTHATFRCGHAMVRSHYLFCDGRSELLLGDLLDPPPAIVSIRKNDPGFWRIDWRKFYGEEAQLAQPLRPVVTASLVEHVAFQIPRKLGNWKSDLVMRDLARSIDSGVLSVGALTEFIAPYFRDVSSFPKWISFRHCERARAIAHWLESQDLTELPPATITALTEDPPLYLYLLLEASLPPEAGGGGQKHLGVLGSIIVAESLLPAIIAADPASKDAGKFKAAKRAVLGDDDLPETMLGMIGAMSAVPTT